MITTFMIINIILMVAISAAIVGFLSWAIATQSRDSHRIREALVRRRRIDRPAHVDRQPAGRPESRRAPAHRSVEA